MPKKNPWLAAVLNFLLYGLGYIYNGKRVGLGILLLVADLVMGFIYMVMLSVELLVFAFPLLLMAVGFAYDGYKEAEEISRKKR
ncbi:MAG: hypothetical protein HY517_01500 [Candidatus Aenigmarchaeota archaeon]|nr:hypothetical protein [Candidatus Aenigmarchaeota archaeon]